MGGVNNAANISAGQFGANTGGGDFSFPAHILQENGKVIQAKNATGAVEAWMWPRWTDNIMYTNFGAAGWNIRNNASTSVMFMTPGGNVGIGTATPTQKLDVMGNVNAAGLCISGDCKTNWSQVGGGTPSQWTTSSSNIFYNSGNVGIGTPSPAFLLDVSGSTDSPFRVRDVSGREYFSTTTRTGTYGTVQVVSIAGSRLIIDNSGPEGANDTIVRRAVNSLIFSPSDTSGLSGAFMVRQVGGSSILYIDQNANGNVGIGTTNPQAKLDVQGNVSVTGNISATGNIAAKYQDVAEWVPSRHKLAAGTVVVLDIEQSNQVTASTRAYDTKVAGVVSAQPGVILGEAGENKAMVATTGRVKVKVDATRAPIKVGDLLVTSEKEGVAMKSEPLDLGGTPIHRPGTLIGKALEPLEKGTSEILVLLSLQ